MREALLGRGHAERILPMVEELLRAADVALRALSAIAFGRGPGAFTGVRLAASVTQGLAFGAGLPVVPISDLRALAQRVLDDEPAADRVLVCNDARMQEVYSGTFERGAAGRAVAVGAECVGKPELVPLPPQWSAPAGRRCLPPAPASPPTRSCARSAPAYGASARGSGRGPPRSRAWRPRKSRRAGCSRPQRPFRSTCAMMWRRCPGNVQVINLTPDRFDVMNLQHSPSVIAAPPAALKPSSMPAKHVLIVEDERPIREMIAFGLKRAGFEVREAEDCRAARAALADSRPDLVLVDWMLPDMSGLELTRALKRDRETRELPVIMLTARAEEGDKVAGLEGGADDYVTKPFSPRELLARINAVLRRSTPNGVDELIEFEGLILDQGSHRVMVGERTVALGPTEYRMLEFFMTHPERVYTRDQLLDRIWGGNVYVEERTIDVHIRRLRKALEDFGYDHFVQTVRGSGYRFSARTV